MSIPVTFTRTFVLFAALALAGTGPVAAQMHKARLGDALAPFTLPELDGNPFEYRAPREQPAIVVFLAPYQKRSERAVAELAGITTQLRADGHPVDLLLVISGGEGHEYFRRKRQEWALDAPMLIDADDELWGRLGVAVTPTTILIDANGRIGWIRAGHSYNFAVAARTGLETALGLAVQTPPVDDAAPEAPPIEDVAMRVDRHLRLGRILTRRGHVDEAVAELRKADTLTQGATTVRLELARLLCRAERPEQALALMEDLEAETPAERARLGMIAGWAHRQLGDLDEALRLLGGSVALDPGSSRALFELGRVHEARGECAQAMDAYRRALEVDHDGAESSKNPPDIDAETQSSSG